MPKRVNGATVAPPRATLFDVKYFDDNWEELEHLRAEAQDHFEVRNALDRWLVERHLMRKDGATLSPLRDATYIGVEEL